MLCDFDLILTSRVVADPEFSQGCTPTPKIAIIFQIFAKNCMKMKEFGPPGGLVPGAPLGSANAEFSISSVSQDLDVGLGRFPEF